MDRRTQEECDKDWADFLSRSINIEGKVLLELDLSVYVPKGTSKEESIIELYELAKRKCLGSPRILSVTITNQ